MHTIDQASVLKTADQQQLISPAFPTGILTGIQTSISQVGGKCGTTALFILLVTYYLYTFGHNL